MSRTVIAAPLYQQEAYLSEALDSLLAQSDRDFALVLVDDGSTDETAAIAGRYAERDPRVTLEVNPRRLGMLANTRKAVKLALARHPEAEFVALASDHDVWDSRWLGALRELLDRHPDAVLAYPLTERIGASGVRVAGRRRPWRCQTLGLRLPWGRVWRAHRCMVAGDMIYGLFRASALRRAPFYRSVLVPDRLMLCELARHGAFVQADSVLWRRRFVGLADLERQRRAFWPDGGAPAVTRLPWWLQHALVAAWAYGVRGAHGPRRAGLAFAAELLAAGVRLRVVRRLQRVRLRIGALLEAPTRAALRRSPRFRRAVRAGRVPVPADTQTVLEGLLEPEQGEERSGC